MNIKELAGTIVTCAAAASLIYGAGIKTGLVIGEAEATEIAQEKANEVHKELLVLQQQFYLSQKEDDKDQVEADIEILKLQIEGMEAKPVEERSAYEEVMLGIWKKQIAEKVGLLVKLNEPEPAP
jgi:hypothetical protein